MTDFQRTINWLNSIGYRECTLGVASVMAYKEYAVDGDEESGFKINLGQGEASYDQRMTVSFIFKPDGSLDTHRIQS